MSRRTEEGERLKNKDDVLSQALGSKDPPGRVRGVGKYVTPKQYFHTPKLSTKRNKSEMVGESSRAAKDSKEKEKMAARIKELEEELIKYKKKTANSENEVENVLKEDEQVDDDIVEVKEDVEVKIEDEQVL